MTPRRIKEWAVAPFREYPHLGYLLLALLSLFAFGPYLKPLLVACFIGYLLIPIVRFLSNKCKLPKLLAVILVIVILYSAFGFALFNLVPVILSDLQDVIQKVPAFLDTAADWLSEKSELPGGTALTMMFESWAWESKTLWNLNEVLANAEKIIESSAIAFSTILDFVLVPVFIILIYAYTDFLGTFLNRCLPLNIQPRAGEFVRLSHRAMLHYFRGLFFVMLALAVMYSISLTLFGIQYGLTIGIISGFLIVIPYLGVASSAFIALMSALLYFNHWSQILGVALSFSLFPMIDGFILSPTFIGVSIGMPAGLVLLVLLVGGTWFGILGAVYAVPIALLLKLAWMYKKDPTRLKKILKLTK